MNILLIIFTLLVSSISLVMFIDRSLLSNKGFSNYMEFYVLTFLLITSIPTLIISSAIKYPNLIGSSTLYIIFSYHIMVFLLINLGIISALLFIFFIDNNIKIRCKRINLKIISSSKITYCTILKNKEILKTILVISYFLSTVVILFPIPNLILNSLESNNEIIISLVNSELDKYQQLFVFSIVPILFSLSKKS